MAERAQASSNTTTASRILLGVSAEAHRQGLARYEYEARLTLGEIEVERGQVQAGRARLADLEKEAASKGFGPIASRAPSGIKKTVASEQPPS